METLKKRRLRRRLGAKVKKGEAAGGVHSDAKSDTTANRHGEPLPRLPHERDESADSQAADHHQANEPRTIGGQAWEDVQQGLRDTDRGPAMDEVYGRTLRSEGPPRMTPVKRRDDASS